MEHGQTGVHMVRGVRRWLVLSVLVGLALGSPGRVLAEVELPADDTTAAEPMPMDDDGDIEDTSGDDEGASEEPVLPFVPTEPSTYPIAYTRRPLNLPR